MVQTRRFEFHHLPKKGGGHLTHSDITSGLVPVLTFRLYIHAQRSSIPGPIIKYLPLLTLWGESWEIEENAKQPIWWQ